MCPSRTTFFRFSHASPPSAFTIASSAARAFAAFFSPDSSIVCDGASHRSSSACARTPGGIASNPKASPTANPFRIRPPYFLLIPDPYPLVPSP